MLYAGGTELLLVMKEGLLRPHHLIDLKGIPGLGVIGAEPDALTLGALALHRTVERSGLVGERCPLLAGVARHVANVRVRSVGTVGGNLAFADPHSDLATVLLAFDAEVRLWSRRGERDVALAAFIRGPYETAREAHEVLSAVRLPLWPAGTAATYLKFGVHERPTLGVAVALLPAVPGRDPALRLTVGCVGPRPQRLVEVEGATGAEEPTGIAARAADLAALASREVDAIDDTHGSADYKRDMTRVFVRRALEVAAARARGHAIHARYAHTAVV
jgi:carbon-monoxide dehydrogenase medium subunit